VNQRPRPQATQALIELAMASYQQKVVRPSWQFVRKVAQRSKSTSLMLANATQLAFPGYQPVV
jgi:hypothetical protein